MVTAVILLPQLEWAHCSLAQAATSESTTAITAITAAIVIAIPVTVISTVTVIAIATIPTTHFRLLERSSC